MDGRNRRASWSGPLTWSQIPVGMAKEDQCNDWKVVKALLGVQKHERDAKSLLQVALCADRFGCELLRKDPKAWALNAGRSDVGRAWLAHLSTLEVRSWQLEVG
jgi:hypothetical protein